MWRRLAPQSGATFPLSCWQRPRSWGSPNCRRRCAASSKPASYSSAARRRWPNICSSTPLVQDTAYSTLLRGPRQALHRRIAEALEQRFPDLVETRPEILAHHYGEASIADKAIAYWHRAGKLSVAKSAVHEAIAQLRRGLGQL